MEEAEFKKVVRQGFDEAAQGYDNPALRFFSDSAEHLVQKLQLQGNERFLDIAAGTGNVAIPLAKRLKGGRVEAVDLSPGMLQRAREKADRAGLSNIGFHCANAEDLSFPASS